MKINLLCVFCCPESLFFPPPSNFQNSPRLGDRRACHIVYRVDRFDYLGECDRFPGVIISVGMKKEYPVQKDTLSYIAMFETLISPVFQFRIQFVERRKIALIRCIEHYVAAIVVLRRSLEFRGTVWLKELFAQFVLPFALLAAHRAIAVSHQRQKQQHRDPGADFVARGRSTACINGDEHCQTAC